MEIRKREDKEIPTLDKLRVSSLVSSPPRSPGPWPGLSGLLHPASEAGPWLTILALPWGHPISRLEGLSHAEVYFLYRLASRSSGRVGDPTCPAPNPT